MRQKLSIYILLLFSGLMAQAGQKPKKIIIPSKISAKFETFEPSAAIYLEDLNEILVASDDTDKAHTPFLFLMNKEGVLEKNPILIQGLEKTADIESLSQDSHGNLYILSSMGLNKKGKVQPERNLFVWAKRTGRTITLTDSIEIRAILLDAMASSKDPILKSMGQVMEEELDVESSFVKNGELYIGLKNPQLKKGRAVILRLGSVADIFESRQIKNLEIWQIINFREISGEKDLLSDMVLQPDGLLLTSTQENGPGRFWRFDFVSEKLSLLNTWKEFNPESIVPIPNLAEALILFDQNAEPARFSFEKWKN